MILAHPGPAHSDLGILGYEASPGVDLGNPAVIAEGFVNQVMGGAVRQIDDSLADTADIIGAVSGGLYALGGAVYFAPAMAADAQAVYVAVQKGVYAYRAFSLPSANLASSNVAYTEACLSGLCQGAALLGPYSPAIQYELQIGALGSQQLSRQLAILRAIEAMSK